MNKVIGFFICCFFGISGFGQEWAIDDVKMGWNTRKLVAQYFHNSEPQTQWAWEALSHYQFKGNEHVLDFGCGDGKLSALISFMVPKGSVNGVDISQDMVTFAAKMFPNQQYKNLKFQTSFDVDFAQTRLPQKFDVVTSFCVFHLIPNPTKVLKNLREVMQPEGKLVVTLPIGGNVQFYCEATEAMARRGWKHPTLEEASKEMRSPTKIKQVFRDAGFDIEYFNILETRNSFGSKEEMIDWFEGSLTANWNIPVEGRREFFTELADLYLQCQPKDQDVDGFVYFSVQHANLVATPSKRVK